MVTYFVVQAYQRGKRGALVPDEPRLAQGEAQALRLAARLAAERAGVVAFSRKGDPTTGEYEDAIVLAHHGQAIDELLAMAG